MSDFRGAGTDGALALADGSWAGRASSCADSQPSLSDSGGVGGTRRSHDLIAGPHQTGEVPVGQLIDLVIELRHFPVRELTEGTDKR